MNSIDQMMICLVIRQKLAGTVHEQLNISAKVARAFKFLENGEFLKLISEFTVTPLNLEDLLLCCKSDNNIMESIEEKIVAYHQSDNDCLLQCLLYGICLLELYCQVNYTGPELPYNATEFMLIETKEHSSTVSRHLECDGVYPFGIVAFPQILLIARVLLRITANSSIACWNRGITLDANGNILLDRHESSIQTNFDVTVSTTAHWWCARAIVLHLRMLQKQAFDHVPTLWKEYQEEMQHVLEHFCKVPAPVNFLDKQLCSWGEVAFPAVEDRILAMMAWLEVGLAFSHFEFADKGKRAFSKAKEVAGLEAYLSGALGKRTKYQQSDIAQLILYAKSALIASTSPQHVETALRAAPPVVDDQPPAAPASDEWQHGEFELGRRLVCEANEKGEEAAVREVLLDSMDGGAAENIILEGGPKFAESAVDKGGLLHPLDQAIILALCLDVSNSNPQDGLTNEEMQPYIERILDTANNWMIHSTALLERSWLEFERRKTMDRAMLQIQALIDQHTTKLTIMQSSYKSIEESAPVSERLRYIYQIIYASQHELKKDLAMRYLRCQVFASALNYFRELEMWDEVVTCYQLMQKPHRAELVVREQLQINKTPYMLTALADLTGKEELYEEAWVLSKGRYPRAKRTWAKICYDRGDFAKCVEYMDQALQVQPLVATAWYLKGIACIRLERWEEGVQAFTRCVQQDMEIGEAWANIGAIHMKQRAWSKAHQALTEALKVRRDCWRVLENLVTVCIGLGRWKEVLLHMNSLLDQSGKSQRTIETDELRHVSYIIASITKKEHNLQLKKGAAAASPDQPLQEESKVRFPELSMNSAEDDQEDLEDIRTVAVLSDIAAGMEKLFLRLTNMVKNDPQVWEVCAEFQHTLGRFEQEQDARIKQFRALGNEPQWERSKEKCAALAIAAMHLVDSHKYQCITKSALYSCKMTLQSALKRMEQYDSRGNAESLATLAELVNKVESVLSRL